MDDQKAPKSTQQLEKEIHELRNKVLQQNILLREHYIHLMLTGRPPGDERLKFYEENYGIRIVSDCFAVVSVDIADIRKFLTEQYTRRFDDATHIKIKELVTSCVLGVLSQSALAYYTYSTDYYALFLVNLTGIDPGSRQSSCLRWADAVTAELSAALSYIKEETSLSFCAGISSVHSSLNKLGLAKKEAEIVQENVKTEFIHEGVDNYYRFSTRSFSDGDSLDISKSPWDNMPVARRRCEEREDLNINLERQFYSHAVNRRFSQAGEVLTEIIDSSPANSVNNFAQLKEMAMSHMEIVLNVMGKSAFWSSSVRNNAKYVGRINSARSLRELRLGIEESFCWLDQQYNGKDIYRRSLITDVDEFIQQNYMNPSLNVNMICDFFGVNQTYLSKCYKASTGRGVLENIHATRIKVARELLENGHGSIDDIAEKVGYCSRRTFDRVFCQHVGISPAMFRTSTERKS